MKKILCLIAFLFTFLISDGQHLKSSYDSALLLIERAKLVPAVNIFKSIQDELYAEAMFDEYFSAQYFLAVYYAIVDRNPQAAEDTLNANLKKAIALSGENSAGVAEMYFGLAWLNSRLRQDDLAVENYKKALDIQEEVLGSVHKKTFKTKTNYAQVLIQIGKLSRAESYLLDLLKSYPEFYEENHPEFVRLYTMANKFYQASSEREKQLAYALAALDIGQVNYGEGNERLLQLYRNVSQAYHDNFDWQEAISHANKELDLIISIIGEGPHLRKAEVYNNLGRFYDESGELEKAVKSFKKALAIKEPLLGPGHYSSINTSINLTLSLNELDMLSESSTYLQETIELIQEDGIDKFEVNYVRAFGSLIENLSLRGKSDSVKMLFGESFQLFQENVADHLLSGTRHLTILGMVRDLSRLAIEKSASEEELNGITEHIYWLDSINTEALRKMNIQSEQLGFLGVYALFNEAAIDHFFELYRLTSQTKYVDEMLRFSEKNKATILSPEFAIARLKDAINVPIELLEEERRLLSELNSNNDYDGPTLLKMKLSYDSIISFLKTNNEDYYRLKFATPDVNIEQVQNALPANSTMLSYFFGSTQLYALSISDSTFSVQQQEVDSLASKIADFRERIVAIEDLEELSQSLYQKLIPQNIEGERLIISISGLLAFLPFELLHDDTDYLGLNKSISYLPSLNIWMKAQENVPNTHSKMLAMAPEFDSQVIFDEDPNRDPLVPLPGAQKELSALQEYFKGDFLVAEEATKKQFLEKVSDFNLIHLATHAIIDNTNPNLSRLYFSPSQNEEPFLENHELYNLDMKADLVTLSACNTGIGEIQKGEGANSLARGFIYSGVPAVVVSLWPTSDKSTPELMKHFYQNLNEGQAKDEALRNARKQYLSTAEGKARHPFYWGGFVLIGDQHPIGQRSNMTIWIWISFGLLIGFGLIIRKKFK